MKLYTKTICPKCIRVKSEINTLGLDVEILNMDKDQEAHDRIVEQNIMSAPVLEVDNTYIFDVPKILAKLNELAR